MGDVVRPIASMSTDNDADTVGRDPSVGPMASGRRRPAVAANDVQRGANFAADSVLFLSSWSSIVAESKCG